MSAGTYTTNSPSWQARQAIQRLSEWFEYQFAQLDIDPPNPPEWLWLVPLGQGLFWILIVGLALWLSWLLYRAIDHYRQQRLPHVPTVSAPQMPTYTAQQWWQQANTAAEVGQYPEACRALYMAALQHLNDTETLVHDPSRTDGEYLQSIEPLVRSHPYQLLIRTHERITFGNTAVNAEVFQRCRRAYEAIAK